MTDRLLSIQDVATIVGLSDDAVREAIRDGELRATKLRRRIRIQQDWVADWIAAGEIEGHPASDAVRPILDIPRATSKPLKAEDVMARIKQARSRAA